jgi:hypothetical protein
MRYEEERDSRWTGEKSYPAQFLKKSGKLPRNNSPEHGI